MDKNTLALYDKDEEYVTNLMSYLVDAKSMPIEVQAFTDKQCLTGYIKENPVDILLVSEPELDNDIEEANRAEMMILAEEEGHYEVNGHKAICKYQSCENIMREVMDYYSEQPLPLHRPLDGRSTELIGIYSPVSRCFKTSFAVALGEVLSQNNKTLYVNLEEYSGFHQILGQNYMMDLSDLLFYVNQKKRNFPCKLASVVQNIGGLDFIPPVISPLDLKSVDRDIWIEFFNELLSCDYDKIIIDFGESLNAIMDIMRECSRVYVPTRNDSVSQAKVEQFEALLRIMDSEEILKKLRKLEIPSFEDVNGRLENLGDGELGRYALSTYMRNEE
ncbi:MAG: hypothetical protein IJ815_00795 [Lachnospiraceae bacterium]|nr:hypothetical protein [Lachnospiraceae bacterium]